MPSPAVTSYRHSNCSPGVAIFYELAQSGPAPIANETLQRIAELYRIEAAIRGHDADARRVARQKRSKPILEAMEPWLHEQLSLISQKTELAEAIRYALSHWQGLSLSLDDGRIEIGSNTVERSIRPLALTRKSALFAGSDGGAEHWAVIASLIEAAKLNSVEPHAYLANVVTSSGHPNNRINELLPWAYPRSRPLSDVAGRRSLQWTTEGDTKIESVALSGRWSIQYRNRKSFDCIGVVALTASRE